MARRDTIYMLAWFKVFIVAEAIGRNVIETRLVYFHMRVLPPVPNFALI